MRLDKPIDGFLISVSREIELESTFRHFQNDDNEQRWTMAQGALHHLTVNTRVDGRPSHSLYTPRKTQPFIRFETQKFIPISSTFFFLQNVFQQLCFGQIVIAITRRGREKKWSLVIETGNRRKKRIKMKKWSKKTEKKLKQIGRFSHYSPSFTIGFPLLSTPFELISGQIRNHRMTLKDQWTSKTF